MWQGRRGLPVAAAAAAAAVRAPLLHSVSEGEAKQKRLAKAHGMLCHAMLR